jgi:hypothetical protein
MRKYKMLTGKSGKRWFIAIQPNEGDNVYCEGGPGSDGFGGREIAFTLDSGEVVKVIGPWHSNSGALLADTGYDL